MIGGFCDVDRVTAAEAFFTGRSTVFTGGRASCARAASAFRQCAALRAIYGSQR